MQYEYSTARLADDKDLVLRAADAVLNCNRIQDRVTIAVTGGEVGKDGIKTIALSFKCQDYDIDENVFQLMEGLALDFALSQRVILIVNRDNSTL